jgi:hypothetical protein
MSLERIGDPSESGDQYPDPRLGWRLAVATAAGATTWFTTHDGALSVAVSDLALQILTQIDQGETQMPDIDRRATPSRLHRRATPSRLHRRATPSRLHRRATPSRLHRMLRC